MNNFLLGYRKAALKHAQHQQLLLHTILKALSGISQFYAFAFSFTLPIQNKSKLLFHV
jgi:hypothetical protein